MIFRSRFLILDRQMKQGFEEVRLQFEDVHLQFKDVHVQLEDAKLHGQALQEDLEETMRVQMKQGRQLNRLHTA